jgi:hypothetical protein
MLNLGRGSVLTERGEVEMDALIMEGDTLNSGAVACVNSAKNPIKLARHIHAVYKSSSENKIVEIPNDPRSLIIILEYKKLEHTKISWSALHVYCTVQLSFLNKTTKI